MKNFLSLVLVIAALSLVLSFPGFADGRGGGGGHGGHGWHGGHGGHGGYKSHDGGWRGSIWIGPSWGWWGPPYYPYYPRYPRYYPYYPDYYEPPAVIEKQPPVYVEPREQYYWYYCKDPEGYYPYVKNCPGGWMKVIPPEPPEEKE